MRDSLLVVMFNYWEYFLLLSIFFGNTIVYQNKLLIHEEQI